MTLLVKPIKVFTKPHVDIQIKINELIDAHNELVKLYEDHQHTFNATGLMKDTLNTSRPIQKPL